MKAIIVDDIQLDINLVRNLLATECPEIEVIASATTLTEAEHLLQTMHPDLVFMDIQMDRDGATCFQLLEKIGPQNIQFGLIFITAYGTADNQTKCLQYGNLDFILKPVDSVRLKAAVQKAAVNSQRVIYAEQIQTAIEWARRVDKTGIPIAIERVGGNSEFVRPRDILYGRSNGSMTILHFADGQEWKANNLLGFYENLLSDLCFYRINYEVLLNLYYVKSLQPRQTRVVLYNGETFDASRRKWKGLQDMLKANKGQLPYLEGAGLLEVLKGWLS
jgi:two-component system LytT family response regulator